MLMARTPKIGHFDKEIELFKVLHNDDGFGGKPRYGQGRGVVWADIKLNRNAFTGMEQINFKNTNHITYKVLIRDPLDYDVIVTDIIKYDGKLLYIENVSPKDQRGFYLEIRCYEVSPSAYTFIDDQTGLYELGTGDQVFELNNGAGIYVGELA